jgi:hypothetical protein
MRKLVANHGSPKFTTPTVVGGKKEYALETEESSCYKLEYIIIIHYKFILDHGISK